MYFQYIKGKNIFVFPRLLRHFSGRVSFVGNNIYVMNPDIYFFSKNILYKDLNLSPHQQEQRSFIQ